MNAVAEAIECDPLELPEILHDAIDGDALDGLTAKTDSAATMRPVVSFDFCDCTVAVLDDGAILVDQSR